MLNKLFIKKKINRVLQFKTIFMQYHIYNALDNDVPAMDLRNLTFGMFKREGGCLIDSYWSLFSLRHFLFDVMINHFMKAKIKTKNYISDFQY